MRSRVQDLIALAATGTDDGYLLVGDMELGPIPPHRWQDADGSPRPALAHDDLAALGLGWAPRSVPDGGDHPDDPAGVVLTGTWYRREEGRYVAHAQGYYRALDAALRGAVQAAARAAGPSPRGICPALVLHADGRHEVVADAATLPVVLTLRDRPDLAEHLTQRLREALGERTWPE